MARHFFGPAIADHLPGRRRHVGRRRTLAALASVAVVASLAVATPAVAASPRTPTIESDADITAPIIGDTLTAVPATPGGTSQYQWRRCNTSGSSCTGIAGATNNTYVLAYNAFPANSDIGKTIRVIVTTTLNGKTVTGTSAPTAVVLAPAPALVTAPHITSDGTLAEPMTGDILTVDDGTWNFSPTSYSYEWLRCIDDASTAVIGTIGDMGVNCELIGDTDNSYTVQHPEDDLMYLRVQVTASNAVGDTTADSNIVGPVSAPVLVASPQVSSDHSLAEPANGDVLTVDNDGTWGYLPAGYTGFTYQWLRCIDDVSPAVVGTNCAEISGATNSTYTVTIADDEDKFLRVRVFASNDVGETPGDSNVSGPVFVEAPSNTAGPVLSLTGGDPLGATYPTVGDSLTVDTGTWDHLPPDYSGFAYQWFRCDNSDLPIADDNCAAITDEIGATYTVAAEDAGKWIRAAVTADNYIASETVFSDYGGGAVVAPPVIDSAPTLSDGDDGSAVASPVWNATAPTVLTVSDGTWLFNPDASFVYQWFRCDLENDQTSACTEIVGANTHSYTLHQADGGKYLRAQVTAANAIGSSDPADSNTSGMVRSAPVIDMVPVMTYVSGGSGAVGSTSPSVGATLHASTGVWNFIPALDGYSYMWLRCSNTNAPKVGTIGTDGANCAETGVTGIGSAYSDYTVDPADAVDGGLYLRVQVTASNGNGSSEPAYSAPSGRVVVVPTVITPPQISGRAKQGSILTASDGTWNNSPTSFQYYWYRCNSFGLSCGSALTNPSTDQSRWLLTAADVGSRMKVSVVASKDGAASQPAYSNPTSTIKALR